MFVSIFSTSGRAIIQYCTVDFEILHLEFGSIDEALNIFLTEKKKKIFP
jgi:hypothetical protein